MRDMKAVTESPKQIKKREMAMRSQGLEALAFFVPILGLVFWSVYANSNPVRARHIGIHAGVGFAAWVVMFLGLNFAAAVLMR